AFIDLCARHEENFYKFVHEVHIHDNGLFDSVMGWLEGILNFLRHGPKNGGKLDMNGLLAEGIKAGVVELDVIKEEVNNLIKWQIARKKWHEAKTRQKMGGGSEWQQAMPGNVFHGSDFGLNDVSKSTHISPNNRSLSPQGDLED